MSTFLVTGGTGFIGAAIVNLLLEHGHKVKIIDNNSRGNNRRIGKIIDSVEVLMGDIRDESFVLDSARDVDAVVHLAYINGTENFYKRPREILDVAIGGIQNVLEAMKTHEIDTLYLASSSEVYQEPRVFPTPELVPLAVPDPFNPRYSYGLGKIIQEFVSIHSEEFLTKLAIFRPHNIYGPDMGFQHVIPELFSRIYSTNSEKVVLKGDGTQTRSFCHISDFIQGFNLLLDTKIEREIFNIGTREELKIIDLAGLIARSLGREIEFLTSKAPSGETNRRVPDISKITNLGFIQKKSLIEGISEYCKWFTSNLEFLKLH